MLFRLAGRRLFANFLVITLFPAFVLSQTPAKRFLIRDVRVFDGERVHEHRSVLVENGQIVRIEGATSNIADAEIIDGTGRTLLPGLIDAHVHIPDHAEAAARQALRLGVTTQFDMFSAGERLKIIKQLEAEDRPDLSALRTAGIGATVPGGHPTQMGGPSFPTLTNPAEAQAFVDARIAEGSDYIKIIHDDGSMWPWTTNHVPMLDVATMKALIKAAHRHGELAVVHVFSEEQARDAIAAGADGLAHLFLGDSVSPDFAAFAANHHIFIIPTLTTLYLNCGRSQGADMVQDSHLGPYIDAEWQRSMSMPKKDSAASHLCIGTDKAIHNLIEKNVPLLTGTDAPAPGATYGASVHGEMQLLVADGMTPIQALAAATSAPARTFHLSDRGLIRLRMRADLLLVEGDPTKNILDTRNIVGVWKRGIRVQR